MPVYPGARISILIFRPTGNIHPTASEWNVESSFQCWVLPRITERVSFTSPENPKARSCRFSDPVVRHFFLPLPPASMKSAQVCGSPMPLVPRSGIALRSAGASLQRGAPCRLSDALRQNQPVVPGMFHQPAAGLHQPLLQARQRPVIDPPWGLSSNERP